MMSSRPRRLHTEAKGIVAFITSARFQVLSRQRSAGFRQIQGATPAAAACRRWQGYYGGTTIVFSPLQAQNRTGPYFWLARLISPTSLEPRGERSLRAR
jgi:hypothetical protein